MDSFDEIPIARLRSDENPIDYVALTDRPKGRALITLVMICCNEEDSIADCLMSVKPYIDQWVIAIDEKSNDNTRQVILKCLSDLPGRLYTHPWFDFSTNRNMALRAAESHCLPEDGLLLMDADDRLIVEKDFALPKHLEHDYYDSTFSHNNTKFYRVFLLRAGAKLRYYGRIHEMIYSFNETAEAGFIFHATIIHNHVGTRSKKPMRFMHDAYLLEQDLLDDPQNTRSMFYLARSYRCCEFYELAIDRFRRRFEMEGGWQAERFHSLLAIGDCLQAMNKPWPEVMDAYLAAWRFDRNYAEPLYAIMRHYAEHKGDEALVVLFGREAIKIPPPTGGLFINMDAYEYHIKDTLAVALYWLGEYQEAAQYNIELYHQDRLPESHRERIAANWRCCMEGLGKRVADNAVPPAPKASAPMKRPH